MENTFCQSCGMPLTSAELHGTNKDNSASADYCHYCFKDGAFTKECTMDEMITFCAQFVDEYNKDAAQQLTKDEAIAQMKLYFPTLKRWAKA